MKIKQIKKQTNKKKTDNLTLNVLNALLRRENTHLLRLECPLMGPLFCLSYQISLTSGFKVVKLCSGTGRLTKLPIDEILRKTLLIMILSKNFPRKLE